MKVEKEKQTILTENEKLSREEKALWEEQTLRKHNREERKKRTRKRKKTEVALATSNSEQNSPAKSGIAGPDTCEASQMRSCFQCLNLSLPMVSLRLLQKVQHFLKIKERVSYSCYMSNAILPDERKKTSSETQTMSCGRMVALW